MVILQATVLAMPLSRNPKAFSPQSHNLQQMRQRLIGQPRQCECLSLSLSLHVCIYLFVLHSSVLSRLGLSFVFMRMCVRVRSCVHIRLGSIHVYNCVFSYFESSLPNLHLYLCSYAYLYLYDTYTDIHTVSTQIRFFSRRVLLQRLLC